MKDKSKIILIVVILAVAAIIAYVCYGFLNGKKNPVATMDVSYIDSEGNRKTGTVKIELNPEVAPETVANFIQLANNGFYNGLTFHRVVTDFVVQGGDKLGTGAGSALLSDLDKSVLPNTSSDYNYSIKGEFSANGVNNTLKFEKGVIGMARSDYSTYGLTEEGYNSASSQFFIVTTDDKLALDNLNQNYASFGKVVEGYEILEEIAKIYGTDESATDSFSISNKQDEELESGNTKVTLTASKELNTDNLPEGWTASDDKLTISKEMQKSAIEVLNLTDKDGTTLKYVVVAGEDNVAKMTNVTVDTFGAKYELPETINYDEILSTVQQYQSYYDQLMSSYSSSETETEVEAAE